MYAVYEIEEIQVRNSDKKRRAAYVGVFINSAGESLRVWLPGIVSNRLRDIFKTKEKHIKVCIRPLGPKTSSVTKRNL